MTIASGSLSPCFLCHTPTAASPHWVFNAPVCSSCLLQHTSNTANRSERGVSDELPMFSVEFEVRGLHSFDSERALILLRHGYLRTYDCTVDDEYKSPRYRSVAAFQEVLPLLDQLSDLVDPLHCGTHIHIDCPMQLAVKACYLTIFGPLIDYLDGHSRETQAFWGRYSTHALVSPSTSYRTLEFRKPCFRTSAQYLPLVQFCRQVGRYLDDCLNEASPTFTARPLELMGSDMLTLYREALARVPAPQEVSLYV